MHLEFIQSSNKYNEGQSIINFFFLVRMVIESRVSNDSYWVEKGCVRA